MPIILFWFHSS